MRVLVTDPVAVEQVLRAVQPAVRLVRQRHVTRARRELAAVGDPRAVWVPCGRLADLDFTPAVDPGGCSDVLLLAEPDDVSPRREKAALLREYWRMLVRADVQRRFADLPNLAAAKKLATLGGDAVAEVRCVLAGDRLTPADADNRTVYAVFASVAADALAFEPERFGRLFPLLADDEAVRQRLTEELSVADTALRLRPEGVTDAIKPLPTDRHGTFVSDVSAAAYHALHRGNRVRAAITLARAGDKAAARTLRDGLVADLARTLGWAAATAADWDHALRPLLAVTAGAGWGRAARCLYDLQRIVTDLSGEVTDLAPLRWLVSLGREPLRRSLPLARPVLLVRHLATARNHLRRAGLPVADYDRLDGLMAVAQQAAEREARSACEPIIRESVTAAGLSPSDRLERVALDAIAAELLDRATERGFVRFGDLRDAVARNGLKLPDLAGVGEWWRGDALLRADRRLGQELAGVYRPAEVYLRAIHRGTSAAFGTAAGRWLSMWVVLPFGGGVMAVEFAKYVAMEVSHLRAWVLSLLATEPTADPLDDYFAEFDDPPIPHAHSGLAFDTPSLLAAFAVGLLILLLVHRPAARQRVIAAVGRFGRVVFADLPSGVWNSPAVRAVRESRWVRAAWRAGGTAALFTAAVVAAVAAAGGGRRHVVGWGAGTFVAAALAVHTPFGRRLEEDVAEELSDGWRAVRHGLVPGLVSAVVDLFRAVADRVERGLYAVDEWLRFRDRDGGPTLAVKAVVAVVWLPLAYLVRFAFYLLVEPQVNPVKHFPVVTVSHKLLLPAVPSLSSASGLSVGTTAGLVSLVPGVFGFVAWELKESWRLYAANRPAVTPPVPVGHHGETVRGLLVPGFHRGTLPKLFARLRRASDADGVERADHDRHEVEHALARFVERHLIAHLTESAAWKGIPLRAGPVRLGVRTADLTVAVPRLGDDQLRVVFVNEADKLTARLEPPCWLAKLPADQLAALKDALCRFGEAAGTGSDGLGVEGLEPPTSTL